MNPALITDGLFKRFGPKVAVDNLSLQIPQGHLFGLVGPNGAGKTTAMSMICGLLRPDSGTARVLGNDVWADPVTAKKHIGVLPDGVLLFDRLTGVELLRYNGRLRRLAPEVVEEVSRRGLLEVLPLTHIRGRSLHDAFVIVDEAQSLERNVLLTVLSRMGQNAKIVLTHDVSQRDNLRVGRYDGIAAVIEDLKGCELFAHTTLVRSERSAIADLVTHLLDY